jgi:hypothetical protein
VNKPSPWKDGDKSERAFLNEISLAAKALCSAQVNIWGSISSAATCIGTAAIIMEAYIVQTRSNHDEQEKYVDKLLAHMRREILRIARDEP